MVVQRVGRAYAAANRRDFEVILVGLHPETEYRPGPDLIAPDQPAVFHGHDGYMAMWREIRSGHSEDLRFDPEEIVDLGTRSSSPPSRAPMGPVVGIAVEKPVFQLFRIENGLVVWQRDFSDRAKALDDLGSPKEA